MKYEIRVVLSLKDNNDKERNEFSVVLGKKPREDLQKEISEYVYEFNKNDKLKQLVNNYTLKDPVFKKYESPFDFIESLGNFEAVNDELFEMQFYSKKYEKIIKKGLENKEPFSRIRDEIVESDF